MNLSAPFLRRPIGTALLTLGIALAGAAAFLKMPVAPLPQIDFPTINVSASLPGAVVLVDDREAQRRRFVG